MGDLEQVQGKDVYIYSIDGSVGLTELRTTLSQRMADGKGWGISQLFVDNDTRAYSVELTIGDSSQSPLNFSTHYTGTPYLKSSSGYHASFYCRNDAFIVSFGRVNSSIEVAYSEPIYGATSKPWFLNFDINYPSGYEGTYAPTAPPAPPTTLYTGTVDCGGVDPAYVLIAQAGNTGPATMTPTTFGRADWSYNLTDDDYGIEVGCGDKIANSYALVSPATSSNDWVCNIIDDPHYCVLS